MKIIGLSIVLLLLLSSVSNSQGSYTIYYRSVYVKSDTDIRKAGVDLVLAIKDSQSYTYGHLQNYVPPIKYPLGSSYIPKSAYVNINKKLIIHPYGYTGELKTFALVVYDFPDYKWEITKEKKIILDDTCIKAIGKSKDRKVIAWYSPNLPSGFGIYNLGGLPGTILEIYYPENQLQTSAIHIDKGSHDIIEPTYARRVSEKTYVRRRDNANGKIHWREKDFISE